MGLESISMDLRVPNGFHEKNFDAQAAFSQAIFRMEDPLAELLSRIDRDGCVVSTFTISVLHTLQRRQDWAFGREMLLGLPSNSTFQSSWRWERFLSKLRSQDIPLFMHDRDFQKVGESRDFCMSDYFRQRQAFQELCQFWTFISCKHIYKLSRWILMAHSKELVVELPRVMKVEKILLSSNTNNLECEVFGKEDQDGEWKFLGKTGREARFKLTKLRFILVKPLSGFEVSTIVSFYGKDNAQMPVEEFELKYINPRKVDYQKPFKVGQLSKDTLVTKAIIRSNLQYYKFQLWGNIEYPCQWWFPLGYFDQDKPNPKTRELTIRYFDVKIEGKLTLVPQCKLIVFDRTSTHHSECEEFDLHNLQQTKQPSKLNFAKRLPKLSLKVLKTLKVFKGN
ncbi:hypothetical protein SELMODRAFT_404205 [Selaginella moellendorffii]|uniref:Uncharacterized protein n=1 Tax=Selaginella moellendorffii TaxID=88036 RepID=D8QUL2_SELML|nr:hypothetical protein SELMODRAFT_404205 [Selaginella moellendorffii]